MVSTEIEFRSIIHKTRISIISICFLGIILSLYAYYVEFQAEHNSQYKALCDISSKMSCSKVFKSRWGKGFGLLGYVIGENSPLNLPNSVFGIVFYCLQIMCALSPSPLLTELQFSTSVLSNIASVYLAYILYFILDDFCVVCVSTYITNALLFVFIYLKRKTQSELQMYQICEHTD
ncbi:hypothetical protein FSP39_024141 [Pinctada imbricata]|uniref:vitamin-K-epoxide reductase (warfarin-sensitive) n=1 Tax=Pinctada imbricata TaxID=66713 RepID=A0AA88XPM3_PINIB|nr:hypothetical protein FSP39_024141 [Pinctada imbricata]